ncbi:cyun35 [Cyclophragma undans nucleopolyhedrovirus]|uniref:Cyun35 n=1 Tax=Cyclophragma undans nucleopolyhedrovirus TaxID=1906244 RepID=A0A288QA78_9ABAC|nr:cyun35 [Cyclophragma undans nucleopolyhedrovirus]AOT85505.1 cyun35 [Cyclophragma undans nucleopolyhedrovirus]
MGLLAAATCCSRYTRLSNNDKRCNFSLAVVSYINATLCTYATMVVCYMLTFSDHNASIYLQYWLMLSLLLNAVFNMPVIWWPKHDESDEIIYQLKLYHSLFLANIILQSAVFSDHQSTRPNCDFVNGLIHCYVAYVTVVEVLILLGHTMGTYTDYRYVKSCYMLVSFVCVATAAIFVDLSALKGVQINITFSVILSILYLILAVLWSLKNSVDQRDGHYYNANLQSVKIIPPFVYINQPPPSASSPPPPPFSSVEMTNFKNKI